VAIHNIAFQGKFPATVFSTLGLPASTFGIDGLEYYGSVSYLKGGLQLADAITTVSPGYAREICTPDFGMGLDGVLRARQNALSGIVNGIDMTAWDPETDTRVAAKYSAKSLSRREANRRAIEARFGLDPEPGILHCVVSHLTWQKGMDVLAACLDDLVASGARLALIGTGEGDIENALVAKAAQHKGRVGVIIGYDEDISHLLQSGGDTIVIPSRFEPCGLTQLYGLRYGCVPIVARTGGLADTVIDANDAALSAGVATGFQFAPVDADGLSHCLRRAAALFSDRQAWSRLQKKGMATDVSWRRSAQAYATLFQGLTSKAAT
ncbi:MAG: glycosyltransferase, partial [Alphaproteobacteria bacterium]|nr:glycosyltransferase [Alphaproteobacteria bacterium]